jgi:hypothetical protein
MDGTNSKPAGQSNPGKRCPWCSMLLSDPSAAVCPGCGATLVENPSVEEMSIPGVTVVDPEVKLAEQRAGRELARAKASAVAGSAAGFGLTGLLIRKAMQAGLSAHEDDIDGSHDIGLRQVELPGNRPAPQAAGILPATYEPVPTPEVAPAEVGGPAQTNEEPWRDLPPPSIQEQVAGSEWDPWAGSEAGPAPKPNELSTLGGPPTKPNELSTLAGPAPADPWATEGEERSK